MADFLLAVLVGVLVGTAHVDTSTHWVVTEDGRLEEQPDSSLSLKRPHDLVAFMRQEERVQQLEEIKAYISDNQDIVDSTDDKDDGFEEKFLMTEESCVKAGKRLPEFDLYISTVLPLENKGIRVGVADTVTDTLPGDTYNADLDLSEKEAVIHKLAKTVEHSAEDHLNLENPPSTEYSPPHCNSPLPFSMYAFEHLEGVQGRRLLQGMSEIGLKSAITRRDSEDEYGHLVNEALKLNQTSWVLYNMAAFYWRIKGNSYEAIECLRRALHYSPSDYRDIAYVSLGNILHRSKYSHEAAIVVEAALDLSSTLNVHHFTLGNIYAVLTEYNRSIHCFDNTLSLQPDFEAAEKRRWAVICHAKLEQALEEQHRNLQLALENLRKYQKKHESLQQLTEKMVSEQAFRSDRVTRNAEFFQHERARKASGRHVMGEHCHVAVSGDEHTVVCEWTNKELEVNSSQDNLDIERKFSSIPITDSELERMREETDRVKALEEGTYRDDVVAARTRNGAKQDYSKPVHPPTYAAGEQTSSALKPAYLDSNWPSKEECEKHNAKPLGWQDYPSTFLPPENKGFDSHVFLTEAIDIQAGEQHALPWYPPVCVNIVDLKQGEMFLDHIEAFQQREKVPLRSAEEADMRKIMLSWVNGGEVEEEEVGQRILTALKQNLAPRWLLYNLAGLYWRVVGNNYHAIECLRRSLHFVPADYVDVPLVNVANIFLKWNKSEDALNMTRQALIFCPFEPVTHFTQANLLAIRRNETGAIHHYERALEYDSTYTEALDMLRNLKCVIKYSKDQEKPVKEVCKATQSKLQKCKEGGDQPSCLTIRPCEEPETNAARDGAGMIPNLTVIRKFLSLGGFLRKNNNLNPTEADAMKEFHKASGLCSGDDCEHIVHKPGTTPCIKIKAISSDKWTQRMLFVRPDEEIEVKEGECYILKDGERLGCTDSAFTSNMHKIDHLEKVLTELLQFIDERQAAGELMIDDEENLYDRLRSKSTGELDELEGFVDIVSFFQTANVIKTVEHHNSWLVEERLRDDIVCVTTEEKDHIRCFSKKDASPDQIELPGVKPRTSVMLPQYTLKVSTADCEDFQPIDFKSFTSTWLSVTGKHSPYSKIGELLDMEDDIDSGQDVAPICEATPGASVSLFDHLPSIADKDKLHSSPEPALRDVIENLGPVLEPSNVHGIRIGKALAKNPASWALGCLGALYWRVEGHVSKAISCLRMALMNSPTETRHIPLLSLANILHNVGAIDDALEVALAALESSPDVYIIHFSIGNMYATKGDFSRAVEYYQSTLALQESFNPARERLVAIACDGLLPEDQ